MAGRITLTGALARRWVVGLLLFVAGLIVYAPTASDGSVSTDVAATSLTSWQIAKTGAPWMESLDLLQDGQPISYFGTGAGGHTVTARTPGPIWAGVPFYLGASAVQEDFDHRPSGLAAAVLSAGAVTLVFLALHSRMSTLSASGVTAAFALATPMWSVSADALWTHSVTVFGLAGAAYALSRDRWWLAGVGFGIAILGRPHIALVAAVVGLGLACCRRSPSIAARLGVASAAGLGLLLWWNRYVFGVWDVRSGYSHSLAKAVPGLDPGPTYLRNLGGFVFSPDRGMLIWTPLLILLLPAVIRSWRTVPAWSRWLAVGGLVYSIVQLQLNPFTGGDAFYGYRLGLELLVCVTPLYAFCLPATGAVARALAPIVLALQFAAISFGALVEGLWLNQDDAWHDNSLFYALRHEPERVGLYLALAFTAGLVASTRWAKEAAAAGDRPERPLIHG